MKFTLAWLKEHLDTDASLTEIADKLTMIGLEVERIEDPAKALAPFKTAAVISAEKHPNADRLRVCMVDTGQGAPVQVVCGAPNARAGLKGVFAHPGTFIPGTGIDLKVGKIRTWKVAACSFPSASSAFPTITTASSICRRTRRLASRSPS